MLSRYKNVKNYLIFIMYNLIFTVIFSYLIHVLTIIGENSIFTYITLGMYQTFNDVNLRQWSGYDFQDCDAK